MPRQLATYLAQRADAATFLLPSEYERSLEELFPRTASLLPQPYRIYPADETQPPVLGFPVADAPALRELDGKLDRWLTEEVAWQVGKQGSAREKAQLAFSAYLGQLMKLAENALMSNLLNDYHAIFWLAHSFDLARQLSTVPRRVSTLDTQVGRTQGDALKYRIYSKWASETREQMAQLTAKAAQILDGEEQRGLALFRLLQDDVLVFTEEFIGPDLRELRTFINGYLRLDFQAFRDGFERLRTTATDLLQRDSTFRAALPLFGARQDHGISVALLLDARFQSFLFDHPTVQNVMNREQREQFQLIARRLREFAVLNQLRRGIVWLTTMPDGHVIALDKRSSMSYAYSRSTRPLDFGKPGVVDPMVHRFGLIYDISAFSETLGNIRRGGGKEELKSYRQMLLFQRKLEAVAERHLLQFEKFLGDGAFYTTRRALRLVRAALEIQRFYSEMKRKGFAFNKGLRIALNYGYYRLLPMKTSIESDEQITEFYGPGIVELSRLTTGKANKEIEEIAAFLVARGFDAGKVQAFFAPLARGADVIDHTQHAREFYAYLNENANLINEGIVASLGLLQELSAELANEGQTLQRLRAPFGHYIGFSPALPGLEYVGIRLLGSVSLKGLDDIEVGEIVPFTPGEAEASPIEPGESFLTILRQDFHQREKPRPAPTVSTDFEEIGDTTTERMVPNELVICIPPEEGEDDDVEVLIGEWDPLSDHVHNPLRLPRGDFRRLFALKGELTTEVLARKKNSVRDVYHKLSERLDAATPLDLADYREEGRYVAYVLGEVVEKL